MFVAYFDESGTHGESKTLVISGYVASADQWSNFDTEWKCAMAAEGLTHFHMKDFAHSKKEFERWKGDETRRKSFIERLIAIIRKNTRKSFSNAVVLDAYREINSAYLFEEYFGKPYVFCARMCFAGVDNWQQEHGYQDPVSVIFEDGVSDKGRLISLVNRDNYRIPQFGGKLDHTPLQAADLVAWENLKIYNEAERTGQISRLRNSFRALYSMPTDWAIYTRTNLEQIVLKVGVPARSQAGTERKKSVKLLMLTLAMISLSTIAFSQALTPQPLQLKPTPKTVAWGYYDASTPPVMRVKSGDTVEIQTLITSSPTRLEGAGVKPEDVEQSLRDIYREVTNKGPGGHILTGPIFVEGAEPGDVLEVRIKDIKLAIPYAYNAFSPGRGYLPEDFPYARMRIIPLDAQKMVAHFADGIDIPLHPFFGSIGVAPPEVSGRVSSAPPWVHAGNLDNKELVAGTTLYIPVHAKGALLLVGDGHAGQGNGEVDITAMETSLIGTFQLIVRKDMKLRWPRAETPTHYISMGIHEDLNEATKMALREMIDFLVNEKHLTRDDAYQLSSVAADLDITQLVDGNKGVHAMIPKAIFTGQSSNNQPSSNDDLITLSRTACFGTCPIYTVTISSAGAVTFNGERFVKNVGLTQGRIDKLAFRDLVREFEKLDYFTLPDEFVPGTKACPNLITDMPSADTSIRLNGKTKRVAHYHGCGSSGVLAKLTALENRIDEVAGTQKWIK